MRWPALSILAAAVILSLLPLVRWADVRYLHEAVRDQWGRWRWQEDWRMAPAIRQGVDYDWLVGRHAPVKVAHALGDAGGPSANTIAALRASLDAGFDVVEVDLWLDAEGHLRCHHGPLPPAPYRPGDCEFGDVLNVVHAAHGHVILDIKTAFVATGNAAVAVAEAQEAGRSVVFQLYRPEDAAAFERWAGRTPLAGPLITTYLSHRALDHVARHAERMGVRGLVVPIQRLPALTPLGPQLALAVHALGDCEAVATARASGAVALFVTSGLARSAGAGCLR